MKQQRKYRIAANPKTRAAPKKKRAPTKRRPPTAARHRPATKRAAAAPTAAPARKKRRVIMPKARKNKTTTRANPRKAKRKNPARKNPFAMVSKPARKNSHRRSNRKKNPETAPGGAIQLFKDGGVVMLSLVGTRQIPQMILAEKNTGLVGYAANAATAAVLAFGASKGISPRAGYFAALGGAAYLLNRILTEKVSPIGQYLALAGIGDHAAVTSLGEIKDTYFPYPAVFDESGNPVIPQQIIDAARAGMSPSQNGQTALAGINPYTSTPYGGR